MTWKSHTAIATAVVLPFNPTLLVVTNLGATAPDWIEYILKFFGITVEHRGETHYLMIPVLLIIFSFFFDYKGIIFWFGIGYFTHWFADSLTISGVPISPWDNSKVHFFGGKIRTGEMMEYIISFSLLAMSVTIAKPLIENSISYLSDDNSTKSFNAFSIDYHDLNKKHIIDNSELLENRFKFF